MPRHFQEPEVTSHINADDLDRRVCDKMGQVVKN